MARKPLTDAQRAKQQENLRRGREHLAAKRAAQKATDLQQPLTQQEPASLYASPDNPDAPIQPELEVSVNIPEQPAPRQSLKDRLFGSGSPAASKPKATARSNAKKANTDLIAKTLPTIAAGFLSTYVYDKLPDPYKTCAPSKVEVNNMLGPIMAMIARRVEVTGKASQDVIDLANALICSLAYGTRAYITYAQIKREESRHGNGDTTSNQPATTRNDQRESVTTSGIGTGGHDTERGSNTAIRDNSDVSDGGDGSVSNGYSESDLVADMLRRDKQGRVRLGLLPAAI